MKKELCFFVFFTATVLCGERLRLTIPIGSVWGEKGGAPCGYEQKYDSTRSLYCNNSAMPDQCAPYHETQILYGDLVVPLGQEFIDANGVRLLKVTIPAQPAYDFQTALFSGYVGWVVADHLAVESEQYAKKSSLRVATKIVSAATTWLYVSERPALSLSFGTILPVIKYNDIVCDGRPYDEVLLPSGACGHVASQDLSAAESDFLGGELINQIISRGLLFVDLPYTWGGCSMQIKGQAAISGVDCSSLLFLLMRSLGLIFPRNASCQSIFCNAKPLISFDDLARGDLVFFKRPGRAKVNHVVLYVGDDLMLESTGFYTQEEKNGCRLRPLSSEKIKALQAEGGVVLYARPLEDFDFLSVARKNLAAIF